MRGKLFLEAKQTRASLMTLQNLGLAISSL